MPILDQPPAAFALLALASAIYLVLAVHFFRTRWLASPTPASGADRAPLGLSGPEQGGIAAVLAIHAANLYFSMFGDDGMRFSFALAVSVMMWLAALTYWIEGFRTRIEGMLPLVLGAAAVAVALPLLFGRTHTLEHAAAMAFRLHFLAAMLAYSLFTLAALHAVLMGIVERRLHRHAPGPTAMRLPPLLTLETLVFRMVWIAFVLLTIAVGSGVLSSESIYGRPFSLDHKTIFASLSWILVAILLAGRHFRGWRGKTALRWLLAGFIALILAYFGSRFVAEIVLGR
ncbi:MAG TPA: cytochrome c biogenesis protein CcsA [Rhodocyclaceae bacterium]